MKTLEGWNKSGVNLSKYLTEPTEIDEDLFYDQINAVPPILGKNGLIQNGEPNNHIDGKAIYNTYLQRASKYYYLGEFKDCRAEHPEFEIPN